MLKKFLPDLSEDARLDILQKRLSPKQLGALELCDIDIVDDMLDKRDADEMKRDKKQAEKDKRNLEIFTKDFQEMKAKVRAAKAPVLPQPPAKKPRKASSTASSSSGAWRRVIPEGELTREAVLALAPPGCHVWRAKTGTWQISQPPHPRLARSWNKYGERGAAISVLQGAWVQYLDANDKTTADCDVVGLF